ncbi:MAG: hypothetical protein GY711_08265 [bacterium]|nr:hypothetical protein [bacterium]
MSFGLLSAPLVLLGLAALAGALFLLQRLRVRHREVEVPTVLFWREAIEEARARVLVQRFRHPLAYLLFVAIAGLLWVAFAGPRTERGGGKEYVVLLDRSAGMAWPGRFDAALATLRDEVATLPRSRTRVVDCAEYPRTLLAPGEEALLLERRLAGRTPVAAPATVQRALWSAAAAADPERGLEAVVVGDARVPSNFRALFADHVDVRRAGPEPGAPSTNAGITALGVRPARSARPDCVDVLAAVRGGADPALTFTVDGAPLGLAAETTGDQDERTYTLRDVPATGGRLEVRLADTDALALDDVAALRLPVLAPIRVALSPAVAEALGPVLSLDRGVVLDDAEPDVVVRLAGEPALTADGGAVPALELVAMDSQREAFVVLHESGEAGEELTGVLETLGLTEIDVTELASETARPIEVGLQPAQVRGVRIWAELLSDEYDFTRSRAFPLFVARSVRWLADASDPVPFVAAGRPVAQAREAHVNSAGASLDPLGAAFTPPLVDTFSAAEDGMLIASLVDVDTTRGPVSEISPGQTRAPGADGFDVVTWLVLVALLLLALEWILYRTERVP